MRFFEKKPGAVGAARAMTEEVAPVAKNLRKKAQDFNAEAEADGNESLNMSWDSPNTREYHLAHLRVAYRMLATYHVNIRRFGKHEDVRDLVHVVKAALVAFECRHTAKLRALGNLAVKQLDEGPQFAPGDHGRGEVAHIGPHETARVIGGVGAWAEERRDSLACHIAPFPDESDITQIAQQIFLFASIPPSPFLHEVPSFVDADTDLREQELKAAVRKFIKNRDWKEKNKRDLATRLIVAGLKVLGVKTAENIFDRERADQERADGKRLARKA